MRFTASLFLLVLACGPKAPPTAVETASPLLPLEPDMHTGALDNGLQWFVEENGYPEGRVQMRLVVKVGSILEDEDQRGAAHYVEHMAFNGTEHFAGNELVKWLESVGASFGPHVNAYTSFDETVYKLGFSTEDPATVDKGLVVLRDWAGGITFDAEEYDKERGVVIEEWRGSQGASFRKAMVTLPNYFHGSRYPDRLPIGTKESLDEMTRDAVVRYYEDWYRPDLMTVLVTGAVDHEAMAARIQELFGDLKGREEPRERVEHRVPDHEETLVSVYSDPEEKEELIQVTSTIDWQWGKDERWLREYNIEQLGLAIFDMRMQRLRNAPNAPFIDMGVGQNNLTPTRRTEVVGVQSRAGKSLEALEAILTEVRRGQVHGVSESELNRAKSSKLTRAKSRYKERGNNSNSAEISEAVRHVLVGEWMAGQEYELDVLQRIQPTIGVEDVNAWMRGFLGEKNRYVSLSTPDTENLPTEEELLETVARVLSSDVEPWVDYDLSKPLIAAEPEPGTVVEREEFPDVGVHKWTLSNGSVVYLKPTDYKQDEIYIRSWSAGGHSLASDADWFAAYTSDTISNASGAGPYTDEELSVYNLDRRVGMSSYVYEEWHGVNGWAAPDDLPTALTLLHLSFTAPRFDESAFQVDKLARIERLRKRRNDPGTLLSDTIKEVRFGDHMRKRPWIEADLENMDLSVSKTFYEDRFSDASDFEFLFVGSFELEQIEPLLATWIASLPSTDRDETWKTTGVKHNEGPERRELRAGVEPKAAVRMWIYGEKPAEVVADHRAFILSRVLTTVLRERLREDLGGTYGVTVKVSQWHIPRGEYRFQVNFDCDPDRAEELTDVALEVLEEAKTTALDERIIEGVVSQMTTARETEYRSNGAWTSWLRDYIKQDWDLGQIITYEERLAGNTPEALQATAKQLLDLDRVIVVTHLPEAQN